jgi:uncharacterized protein (DUF2141 family)
MRQLTFFFLCICIGLNLSAQDLTLRISGIKQDKGDILIAVFNGPDGFPGETSKAVELLKAVPVNGTASLTIKTLPPGKYAVSLFQDTNGDGKLNTNLLGIPKEGYGVSNNAFNTFSAPVFKDASFEYPQVSVLNMQLKY